ncbi:MAG: phytanoyl-CoA dioxygenase family protein [Gammaproteobacteria bacterium]
MEIAQILVHGIKEYSKPSSDVEFKIEEFKRLGYAIIPDVVSEPDLERTRQKIEEVYRIQENELGSEYTLGMLNDGNIARALLAYDDFFVRFANDPVVMPYIKALMGENYLLSSQVAILNQPHLKHFQYSWHRDLNYQHFTCSKSLAVQALYAIEPFNEETGGTMVLPGSHLFEEFPSEAYVRKHQVQLKCPAGSVLLVDSMVYHRTGENRSNFVRRAINNIFTIPMLQQAINLPKLLKGKFSDDPDLRKILGYEWPTVDSVAEWRMHRILRNRK